MKIRQDYVTNSSSTSFGAATATGLAAALFTAIGISAASSADVLGAEMPDVDVPAVQEGPDPYFDPDDLLNSNIPYEDKLAKLDREMAEYKKEWESTKDTLEGDDYTETKEEYERYGEYLNNKKQDAENMEFENQVEKLSKQAEQENKALWVDERKKDLESTREQIAMVEASIRGYGSAGYDVNEAKSQLGMFKAREADLAKSLKKEGVEYGYKAKPREDIGPSKSVDELMKKVDDKYEEIFEKLREEKMDRKKKEIIERNIRAFQAEGRAQMRVVDISDDLLKKAEVIQVAAVLGVDALEKVTGPAGKTIKKVYVGTKAMAAGAVEASWDPENAASHMAKATVKAAGDVGKEFTDSQLVKDGIGLTSETIQGGIESYQKGESITSGMAKGTYKAGVDIVVDRALNKFIPESSMKNLSFGSYTGKEIIKGLVAKNPIIQNIVKNGIKDGLRSTTSSQLKNLPKGGGFIFGDWHV
jgi:Skp family chaperone for outer membrane proteins